MKIAELKEKYDKLEKKYSLPSFEEMNYSFDIGRMKKDYGHMLRDIRRFMIEKIAHYMKLMEIMLNPSQAPPTFLMLLKEVNKEDKKVLDAVFTSFMEVELKSYKLDIESSEKEEAEFISKIYGIWNEKKPELLKLIGTLERNWKQVSGVQKQSKGYFN